MNEQETKWRPKFIRWIKEQRQLQTCIYELKHTRGKNVFTLSELKEHQRTRLDNADSDRGYQYTIPNSSLGNKGVDGVYFRNAVVYVAINFIDKAYVIQWNFLKVFYDFLEAFPNSKDSAKVLTELEAKNISSFIIVDKKYLQK